MVSSESTPPGIHKYNFRAINESIRILANYTVSRSYRLTFYYNSSIDSFDIHSIVKLRGDFARFN